MNYKKSLKNNDPSFKELDLFNSNIEKDEVKYLSEYLKLNTSLQKLRLFRNNIGNEGCKYLSDALKTNISLQKLNLESLQSDLKDVNIFPKLWRKIFLYKI